MARATKARTKKRVALAIPVGLSLTETEMRGIFRYASQRPHWTVAISPESPSVSISSLRGWSGDGAIVFVSTKADASALTQRGIPAVNVSGAVESTGIPRVTNDNRAIGHLAADHLLACGFRNFAYYGVDGLWYSRERGEGFRERIAAAGGTCSLLLVRHTMGNRLVWGEVDQSLRKWLTSLLPPVAIFACHDYRARMLLEACGDLGLKVPDDVALLGVNNDAFACGFCEPPLSSIMPDAEEVGYQAAAMLNQLMAGKKPPAADVLIPPKAVIQRRSTDVFVTNNPEVTAAVRYMSDHLTEPISVYDVARNQGISLRWLEIAFSKEVGRLPLAYLTYLRTRRAAQVLIDQPKMTLDAVARACGFSDAKRLRAAFSHVLGVGPRQYRQLNAEKTDPTKVTEVTDRSVRKERLRPTSVATFRAEAVETSEQGAEKRE